MTIQNDSLKIDIERNLHGCIVTFYWYNNCNSQMKIITCLYKRWVWLIGLSICGLFFSLWLNILLCSFCRNSIIPMGEIQCFIELKGNFISSCPPFFSNFIAPTIAMQKYSKNYE